MKTTKNMFSRNRKIHNPFKRRNSSSKSNSHAAAYHQNVINALGGIPHDYDFDYSSETETPTVYSSRRSSIYCGSSNQSPTTNVYSFYPESYSNNNFVAAATHTHHHHNDKCCHDANCRQYKQAKRNSSDSYNARRSFTGFKLWLRLTWVKVGRTFR